MYLKMLVPEHFADSPIERVLKYSPLLLAQLRERFVTVQLEGWDGDMQSLPSDRPVLILINLELSQRIEEFEFFLKWCDAIGHLVFYFADQIVDAEGRMLSYDAQVIDRFLEKSASPVPVMV